MCNYLDDVARAAMYEFVEAEDVLEEEVEQLGKIAQAYQAQTEKALTKTQLDDLLGDSSLGTKSVEDVVAGLQAADKKTGTVWDSIKPTQPMRKGTQIPKSFNITIEGQEF